MNLDDAMELSNLWQTFAAQYVNVDPVKAQRFARLAAQMNRMIDDGQCSLHPPVSIDLFAQREKIRRDQERREQRELDQIAEQIELVPVKKRRRKARVDQDL